MALGYAVRGVARAPTQPTLQESQFPAPTGGMDSRRNLAANDADICIYSYNMNPEEYGMAVRSGYQRWATDIQSVMSNGVTTLMPYIGQAADGSEDRLFAVTNEGIYDVTTKLAVPTPKFGWPTTTGDAGYGVFTQFTTDAGQNVMFYADGANGLHIYDPGTDLWSLASGVTGVSVATINFVVQHKQRLWFGARGSSSAFYLPIGAIAGAVSTFGVGTSFRHGGTLAGIFNWTIDGGRGVDDYLIFVSRGGDVLPYFGSDPTATDWSLVGQYFIGRIPHGHKFGADFGGELLLLSEFGITAMGDLLKSSSAVDPSDKSLAFKITQLIRSELINKLDLPGWELEYVAPQGHLIVNVPPLNESVERLQFVLVRTTEGWCFWRKVPAECFATWNGFVVFGTNANTVEIMDYPLDGGIPSLDVLGASIDYSLLTSYNNFGSPARFKRCQLMRPSFITSIAPNFRVKALYDYEISELPQPQPLILNAGVGIWDLSLWDQAVWGGDTLLRSSKPVGGAGIGRSIAVAIRGSAQTRTWLVSIDVMWTTGGVL